MPLLDLVDRERTWRLNKEVKKQWWNRRIDKN